MNSRFVLYYLRQATTCRNQCISSRSISCSAVHRKEQIDPMSLKRNEDFKVKITGAKAKLNWRQQTSSEEWYSKFSLFAPDPEKTSNSRYLVRIAQPIDLRPKSIKRWWHNRKIDHEKLMQSFIPERLDILGNDLAAAHFLVYRGGEIRFVGSPNWIKMDEDGKYNLPGHYDPNLFVEEIRCDGMTLYYEGLENVRRLKHLKAISFKNCKKFDDWCLDRVSGSEFDSLERLDLSGTAITVNGLSSLYRISSLRTLILGTPLSLKESWALCVAMLQEENEKLNVEFVDPIEVKVLD